MFHTIVIHSSPDDAPVLRALAAATGLVQVVRELPAPPGNYELSRLLNTLAPSLVLIDLRRGTDGLDCAARVREYAPGAAIIGYACAPAHSAMARQLGVGAMVPVGAGSDELRASIREALQEKRRGVEGYLYSFLPSKAGCGASTVVLNTAVALARLGKKVLVVDSDLRSGILAIMLGVEPEGSVQSALEHCDELDTFFWRNSVCTSHGVDFLLSSRSLDAALPDWSHYFQLLNFASGLYDAILVDLPELVNPATLEVVRRSRMIFPVSTPEVPALHLTMQRCEELRRMGIPEDRVGILMNRYHKADPAVGHIAGLLNQAIMKTFPNDYALVNAAISGGRPVPEDSRLGHAYSEFAGRLVEQVIVHEPTLSTRLKGMFGFASA